MDFLTAHCQHYPWGSTTLIAALQGRKEASQPEAELWYGAHPGLPATLATGEGLDERIAQDPESNLGPEAAAEFGRLPFLLKILAAGKPLSLQAHPSKAQAEEGYARENAAGVPLSASYRMYKDDNHKPELIVALSRFHAMAGFRPLEQTRELLYALGTEELATAAAQLAAGPGALEGVLRGWLDAQDTDALVGETLAAVKEAKVKSDLPAWMGETLSNIEFLAEHYPNDVGIMGALLLNFLVLEPGEAMYLDAGNLHAYCQGLAVEIMANSDNVLRGGLTDKHIDTDELLSVLRFATLADPKVRQEEDGSYVIPTREFHLRRVPLDAGEHTVHATGPRIVLCTAGEATLRSGTDTVDLAPTQAVWLGNDEPAELTVTTPSGAVLFTASV